MALCCMGCCNVVCVCCLVKRSVEFLSTVGQFSGVVECCVALCGVGWRDVVLDMLYGVPLC